MTDVAEKSVPESPAALHERMSPLTEPPAESPAGTRSSAPTPIGSPVRLFMSVLAASTAILAFAAVEQHLGTSRGVAGTLALVGWFELVMAILIVVRPVRVLVVWALIGNLVFISVWAWQRVIGHGGMPTSAESLRAGLELAMVIVAAALLIRPRLGLRWGSSTNVLLSVLPVAVVVVTTAVLIAQPPIAAANRHATAVASSSSQVGQPSVPVPGQNSTQFQKVAQGNLSEQSEIKPYLPVDPTTQALLDAQLSQAEQAALSFPTVASAKAAGMILAGGMAPGVGAHYQLMSAASLKGVNPDGTINAAFPASWIYASTADNAPVVGVMYESLSAQAPSGFAGPNDRWHQHTNLCIQFKAGEIAVPFAPDSSVTPQQCADVRGIFMHKTVWMVHAWVVPGWESPQGVFSHANLHVYCPGNTDLTDPIGFCLRQS